MRLVRQRGHPPPATRGVWAERGRPPPAAPPRAGNVRVVVLGGAARAGSWERGAQRSTLSRATDIGRWRWDRRFACWVSQVVFSRQSLTSKAFQIHQIGSLKWFTLVLGKSSVRIGGCNSDDGRGGALAEWTHPPRLALCRRHAPVHPTAATPRARLTGQRRCTATASSTSRSNPSAPRRPRGGCMCAARARRILPRGGERLPLFSLLLVARMAIVVPATAGRFAGTVCFHRLLMASGHVPAARRGGLHPIGVARSSCLPEALCRVPVDLAWKGVAMLSPLRGSTYTTESLPCC